eukprot:1990831-Pyramimonas_sp.AAC.2
MFALPTCVSGFHNASFTDCASQFIPVTYNHDRYEPYLTLFRMSSRPSVGPPEQQNSEQQLEKRIQTHHSILAGHWSWTSASSAQFVSWLAILINIDLIDGFGNVSSPKFSSAYIFQLHNTAWPVGGNLHQQGGTRPGQASQGPTITQSTGVLRRASGREP